MVLTAVTGRLWLYSHVLLCVTGWAASSLWRLLRCQPHHPLGWPVDQALNVALLRTLFTAGEYQHWRNFMAVWAVLNPKERAGLAFERVPSAALGHSDGRDSWWITLSQQQQQSGSSSSSEQPPRASCVLLYIHGGGFLAGGPRMYCPAMRLWLEQLAALGVSARILSLGYPLAPEHPYPAALHFVADAARWLQGQLAPGEQVVMAGDSAGGQLVVAALAHVRDSGDVLQQLPAAAVLLSPAADLSGDSVFGANIAAYLAGLQQQPQPAAGQQPQQAGDALRQQQRDQAHAAGHARSSRPQAPGEHDYICVGEGTLTAKHYVRARCMEAMADPLVSPVFLGSFAGLVQRGMLVVWGDEELMAPDIERFVAVVEKAGGVAVAAHVEPRQPHVWPVLPCGPLLCRGAEVIAPYIAGILLQQQQQKQKQR